MQLGLSDHPTLNMKLNEFLDFSSKLNANHVEIKLDSPNLLAVLPKNVEKPQMKIIKNLFASYNFKYFLHAPSIDINLASLNPEIGKASQEMLLNTVHFASRINAELVVSHVGRLSRDYPPNFIRKAIENAVNRLKQIANTAENFGVTFTIENDHKTSDFIIAGYPSQMLSLLKDIDCKLTLDVGHANTLGKIETFFDMLNRYIVNVHLHGNNGTHDEHLPLNKAKISIIKTIEKIKRDASWLPLTLECHSIQGLRNDFNLLRRLL
jgi:sugar phosphate isomerase/epimerase